MSVSTFLNGRVALHAGDCLDRIQDIADASIDSVVTDPPYGLAFMGRHWDSSCAKQVAFNPDFWAEVYRVLKPGGHVLAFGGTRTFHRLVCAVEDAGFEIRDSISWNFGSGFPKSHNVGKTLDAAEKRCSCPAHLRSVRHAVDATNQISGGAQQDVRPGLQRRSDLKGKGGCGEGSTLNPMRDMRGVGSSAALASSEISGGLLQHDLPQQDVRGSAPSFRGQHEGQGSEARLRRKEPGMEGGRDAPLSEGQLRQRPVCEVPVAASNDGADGRLCDGASASDGRVGRAPVDENGVRSSSRSQATQQPEVELGAVAGQSQPQARGAWEDCSRCGKPVVPEGLGTALKPAMELITVARKPLAGTVAENVLAHGTGALNIAGCRIGTDDFTGRIRPTTGGLQAEGWGTQNRNTQGSPLGRWPANLIHDGSDEVIAAFPDAPGRQRSVGPEHGAKSSVNVFGDYGARDHFGPRGDAGSAARFFYNAKADSDDRIGSKHPTVKPVDLMRYLVRLVTPPGGTVLDPFAGTGTTGEAAYREGFSDVLIEREEEYRADIARRMALVLAGPDERRREIIKAKGKPVDLTGTLFADPTLMAAE